MQGYLAGFDAYHKRSKVCYDDGQEEWISLAKERFRYVMTITLLLSACLSLPSITLTATQMCLLA